MGGDYEHRFLKFVSICHINKIECSMFNLCKKLCSLEIRPVITNFLHVINQNKKYV